MTRILIVDDHTIMREGLRALLDDNEDFEIVAEVADGRLALEKARELHPDVVIMDIGMGELNGIEATRQLTESLPEISVIILTTHPHENFVLGALEAGAAGYVLKISAYDELVNAIRSVRRGERFLSPGVTSVVVEAGLNGRLELSDPSSRSRLTNREREVLQLVAEGRTSGEIADRMNVSTRTVEQHRRRLMEKLDLHGVAELTRFAIREGLVTL